MSDLMMALIRSLIANGVKVPAEEPVCLGGDKIACGNELDTVFNLDFSEHDKKVAEEKDKRIAELTEELWKINEDFKKTASENTALQAENDQLYERISDLEFGDNDRIAELEKENDELEKSYRT